MVLLRARSNMFKAICYSKVRKRRPNGKEVRLAEHFQRTGTRRSAFALPAGHGGPAKSFDHVFDFTGEFDYDTPDAVGSVRLVW
jgi:hypothetical protein